MDYTAHYQSPLGGITMASDGIALVALWFDDQQHFGSTLCADHVESPDQPIFADARRWLDSYFSGKVPDFTPSLSLRGSDFRKQVWQILLTIPYGQTMTYADIAHVISTRRAGHPMSAQAVGGAVGHNPISLIIPCHRVIGANGSLTGYAAGLHRKARLLQIEQPHRAVFLRI